MKFKIALLLVGVFAIRSMLLAQTTVKRLVKGDTIPTNLELGKIVNYKFNNAQFSDFKGKLVILDFWSTFCSPCVAGLPRMDSLQKEYGNRIAIIPITREKSPSIRDYFDKRKFILPSIVEDTVLDKIFTQTSLDLHVWINEKGKIIATTNGGEVNFKTVDEYFKTGKVNANERVDVLSGFDYSKPLFVNGNGGSGDDFFGRSIITTKAIAGENTGGMNCQYYPKKNDETMFKSLVQWNTSPLHLYQPIIYGLGKIGFTLFFTEVENGKIIPISTAPDLKDVIKDIHNYTNKANNTINYELLIPAPGAKENVFLREYLLNDLNKYFDFTGRIEKVKLSSWIVIKLNHKDILPKKREKNTGMIFSDSIDALYLESLNSITMDNLISLLKVSYFMAPPIYNETGLSKETITLNNLHLRYNQDKANYKLLNLEEWRAAFQRNGLDIKVEDREVEVMVFKKKETPSK